MRSLFRACSLILVLFVSAKANGDLIFSQYYEGTSNNKWLELKNTGNSAINLSTYSIGVWNNANAEGYKTGVAANNSVSLSGSLAANTTYLMRHTSATLPAYAVSNSNNTTVMAFNGNDSLVLYTGAFSVANIVDAIGFTNAGNQGLDRSFVRNSLAAGYDLTAGSNVTNFASWTNVTLANVDGALVNTDNRLGFSSLVTAVPEPSSLALFGMAACSSVFWRRRR